MQDCIVLGFLMDGDLTGYQIKKKMEARTSYFFTTSLGSIYPALKKLEKNGRVKMVEHVKKGRLQKVYSITPRGKTYFRQWLQSEPSTFKLKIDALLKIFFFSHLSDTQRKKQLEVTLSQLNAQIDELKALETVAADLDVDEYQVKSLKLSIDVLNYVEKAVGDFKLKLAQE